MGGFDTVALMCNATFHQQSALASFPQYLVYTYKVVVPGANAGEILAILRGLVMQTPHGFDIS